jgi:hypothetical protein
MRKEEIKVLFEVNSVKLGCFEAGIPIAGCFALGW